VEGEEGGRRRRGRRVEEKGSIGGWGPGGRSIEFSERESGDEVGDVGWWRALCRAEMVGRGLNRCSASSAPHEPSLKTTRAAVLAARRGGEAVRERGRRL
jgi:hypothetical protein